MSEPQPPAGLETGITELTDLAVAAGETCKWVVEAKSDDGKISGLESITAVKLIPAILRAIKGADQMGREFKELSSDEFDALIVVWLNSGGETIIPANALTRDVMDHIKAMLQVFLERWRAIQNTIKAPKAQPV
jgi:hypothetical protein